METIKKNPLISIVVPVYNVAPYLRQCIESILHQTYPNIEIILVADGISSDGSEKICDEYAAMDQRVKVIHKPHGGQASARKAGTSSASGEYVAYIDSDDWVDLDAYENLVASIGEQSPDILFHGFVREYENKGVICQYGLPVGYYDSFGMKNEIYPHILETHFPYQWELFPGYKDAESKDRLYHGPKRQHRQMRIYGGICKLVKRDILMRSQVLVPDNLTNGEDLVCTVHVLLLANSAQVSEMAPYHYRIRSDSMSRGNIPFKQYKKLLQAVYPILLNYPKSDVYVERLVYAYLDKLLVNQYARFLTGAYSELLFGKLEGYRVALYGAGRFGKEVYFTTKQIFPERIVLWVDKNYNAYQAESLPVKPVEALLTQEYDLVVVALTNEEICKQIKQNLIAMGIASEKIRHMTVSAEILKAAQAIFLEQ